jgi:prephenate dehydrogenase
MRVAFLGLGLIGGSVARALRGAASMADAELVAWTPAGRGPREAVDAGAIDAAAGWPEAAIEGAALVVLAGPPLACVDMLASLGGAWRGALAPGVTVTDVASTKAVVTAAAAAAGVPFVGGHPMAGKERTGFAAGDAGLFAGRPWVVTEAVGAGDPAAVRGLAEACGASPVEMDAARHDRLVAAISHLPLLGSVLLAETVTGSPGDPAADWPDASHLAASGWRDTTRLARGDTTMGADILATNAAAVAGLLRAERDGLDAWLALLEAPGGPDVEVIRARLDAARTRLADEA